MAGFASMSPRLGEIRCPTTVIVGEHDTGTDPDTRGFRDAAEVLASGIAGAALRVIAGAGHSPQQENRRAWLATVEEHLGRLG
jgi:2-succinyl-6-hydroxy-2,4-cyclohexadiene-1-carboxylate synthase